MNRNRQQCFTRTVMVLAFSTWGDGSHSVLSPENMGPLAVNIPVVFPIEHSKPWELGLMMSPYHTILTKKGKSGRERADVEAKGNR